MKQAEDTLTADMYGYTVNRTEPLAPQYSFHIEMMDGTEITWEHLTLRTAKMMYKATDTNTPTDLRGYGWKEMK